ncbi:LytR/AlgR family response regulator transcription factor [Leadbetterella sp. DM7]|uniref:LytR/AlgR family response regulator transcription factor n=1 Tax=Leadbetterella sp. DM7 TaxID=3235085 RepID=UPI00349EAD9A
MKIRTILIDDEELARELVKKFLETETEIEIIGEASDGFEGIKLINNLQPDLVFLDIQMPKLTGLEMLELLSEPPLVVFSTAYDQYAIDAFEKNAIDYLLKPFSRERLLKTLDKVKEKFLARQDSAAEIRALSALPGLKDKNQRRIVIKNGSKIEMIPYEEIHYIESYGDYVRIHATQGKFLKQKTMKELEDSLGNDFLRIHRSFLVNTTCIHKLELYEKTSYLVLLKNGEKLAVSKSGYKLLKDTLGW